MSKIEPKFTPIDLQTWARTEVYYYFAKMAPTGYSLTVELDVTHMKKCLKNRGYKFFPAYLWLVTKLLSKQPEFTTAEVEGTLGYYNCLTPLYAAFHEYDKTFSLMWTDYSDNFLEFYESYLADKTQHGENLGILAKKGQVPPPNSYTVSCVPWIEFKHFAVHSYENKPYYFPSVEAGKFHRDGDRLFMPLSLTCHHAATDGYHVNQFLEELQAEADSFEKYLP